MYTDHYRLTGQPFQLTPDARFWFDSRTHKKAMAYLGYGLAQGEGFIVVTGEIGAGKSTLVAHLMANIDRSRLNAISLVSTQVEGDDMLLLVAQGLGVATAAVEKARLLDAVEQRLGEEARRGRRTLLIVDEAQNLPVSALEELRMLSNFQAGGYPLLQIFLLGQPEFRLTLSDPKLDQLRQRVIAMHHLAPMDGDEVEPYLLHRLSCVGWRGKPRFTNDAIAAMHRWSAGIPRRLNQLASRVLLFGAVERIDSFSGNDLAAVIADLDAESMTGAAAPARRRTDIFLRDLVPPAPVPEPRPTATAAKPEDGALERRILQLEGQLQQQDVALRRVLTLLVDWVESGDTGRRPDLSAFHSTAV
jgi:general secretion pathway protein A